MAFLLPSSSSTLKLSVIGKRKSHHYANPSPHWMNFLSMAKLFLSCSFSKIKEMYPQKLLFSLYVGDLSMCNKLQELLMENNQLINTKVIISALLD